MGAASGCVFAPGRVNLIGDHTDYTGGIAMPIAIDLGTTLTFERGGTRIEIWSDHDPAPCLLPLTVDDPRDTSPAWAHYVAGVVSELRPTVGLRGRLSSTLPLGAGLSSSAALEVAVALALGASGDARDTALLCQRAEQRGAGVPCGVMDQITSLAGVAGAALVLDCRDVTWSAVPLPAGVALHVVHCGVDRRLAGSAYAARRASCERAEAIVGPLRDATIDDVLTIDDPEVRRRATHVVTENARVLACAAALRAGDVGTAGGLLAESHRSLRDNFEVSIPALDALVEWLGRTPGVYGARLTGAGFGGCAVALAAADADLSEFGGFRVQAGAGARMTFR